MSITILRKTGGWCVELITPIVGHKGEITAVELRKPTADHLIRWGAGQIPSSLSLMSELSDIPESLLRKLGSDDFDRVMLAFVNVVPPLIKSDLEQGNRPLATPTELLPEQERVPPPDQLDPRFPAVDGPVRRYKEAEQKKVDQPKPAAPKEDMPGLTMEPPGGSVIEAVR